MPVSLRRALSPVDAMSCGTDCRYVSRRTLAEGADASSSSNLQCPPRLRAVGLRRGLESATNKRLRAGCASPVVASDLPAARFFLATEFVSLASTPAEFAEATARLLETPSHPALVSARRAFAGQHSWWRHGRVRHEMLHCDAE